MTVLVTGGAGYIGSHAVKRLLAEGRSVVIVDNLFLGSLDNLIDARNSDRFVFYREDAAEPCKCDVLEGGDGRERCGIALELADQ